MRKNKYWKNIVCLSRWTRPGRAGPWGNNSNFTSKYLELEICADEGIDRVQQAATHFPELDPVNAPTPSIHRFVQFTVAWKRSKSNDIWIVSQWIIFFFSFLFFTFITLFCDIRFARSQRALHLIAGEWMRLSIWNYSNRPRIACRENNNFSFPHSIIILQIAHKSKMRETEKNILICFHSPFRFGVVCLALNFLWKLFYCCSAGAHSLMFSKIVSSHSPSLHGSCFIASKIHTIITFHVKFANGTCECIGGDKGNEWKWAFGKRTLEVPLSAGN